MTAEDRRAVRGPLLPFGAAEVTGPSMLPTLRHGDRLLVRYGAVPKPGTVAVLRHPFQQDLLIVKRLVGRRDGGWWVLGDNREAAEAVDSRVFGAVPEAMVLGRVIVRYRGIRAGRQRSLGAVVAWLASAPVRPVLALSWRLRAR
ncbi:nickel-type superoxide dismutase maturation protease [Streptomyces sp. MUM 203J]|uniref:nickel-type superoxide dismutase maturation protease n=1 Tax=Streptomyces sp. MUM 203J TaxID=2791990 RepID=UPI001F03B259|nr:nickel-type superoxide dismutase maturation protease [Streptomyces sp. MUM 203J]MCH0538263.1 nickel-type superoxide dismutase maturation protease [Streptomyces sp. MUM 203J]